MAPGETVLESVCGALDRQGRLELRHYIVEGPLRGFGESRVSAIARARNRAMGFGSSPFVMFLDRDVFLPDGAIERLLYALTSRMHLAALGINYQGGIPRLDAVHVAMGAVLFYRSVLERITFRTEPQRCECLCCCHDLRRMGYRAGYLPDLSAKHLK